MIALQVRGIIIKHVLPDQAELQGQEAGADMAMPTAVPMMAYLISGGQGGIEQGALISRHPAKVFHSSLHVRMKSKAVYLDLYTT